MTARTSRVINFAKYLNISPAVGWAIFVLLLIVGLDEMPLRAISDLRPMFWGIALLVIASVYALNELRLLRQQGIQLHGQLVNHKAELESALVTAHENAVERAMAEDALNESQMRYYHLSEATFEAICIHDNGLIIDANQNLATLYGYELQELLGQSMFKLIPAEAQDSVKEAINRETQGDATMQSLGMKKDGTRFPVEAAYKQMPYNGRKVWVVALRDMSGQLKIEEEQEASRRQIVASEAGRKAILESSVDGILIFGEDDGILEMNAAAEQVFGWSRESLVGKRVAETIIASAHRENYLDMLEQSRATGTGFLGRRLKVRALRHDGSEFDSEVTTSTVQTTHGVDFVAAVRDISERVEQQRKLEGALDGMRLAEAEMKGARDAALDSARFKSQFLANMSHEIRTPMNAIVGMTDLLLETQLDAEQADFAGTVKQASESLLTLINQILDFSKIEAGKMTLERQDFDLRELVEGVADMFAARAQAKGVELVVDIAPETPTMLRGDSGRLGQVLVNLVGNAVKFTEKGDVLLKVGSEYMGRDSAGLRFEIKDSGIGIAAEGLHGLFKPFVQADGSITRRFGGTGLGLAISKELVELMGGEIGVESSVIAPKGTCFWARLCLDRQPEGQRAMAAPGAVQGLKVLVVDDNATNCQIVSHQLKGWNIEHGVASSPEMALEMLAAAPPQMPYSAVLLDLQMPRKDGMTLAAEIAADPAFKAPAVILMSSLGHSPAREELVKAGVRSYLNKPVKQGALLKALQGLSQPGPAAPARALPQAAQAEAPKRRARVLVAEDNSVNQRVVRSQLEKLGVAADIVGNGEEALAALEKGGYDLVFMDCQMPVMDGLAATLALRHRERETGSLKRLPVLAMTANALDGDELRCLEAGMDDYLSKPVKLETLGRALDRWIPAVRPAAVLEHSTHDALPIFSEREIARGMGESYKDQELFAELVRLFATDSPPRLERLGAAIQAGDAAVVMAEGHALKGSSRAMGALRMGETCSEIEALGESGRPAEAARLFSLLQEEFNFTLDELVEMAGPSAAVA